MALPQPPAIRNFADGQFVDSFDGRVFDNTDPATGVVFAHVHEADKNLVDHAVAGARRALQTWGSTPVAQRVATMLRIADRIEQRAEEFAAAEVRDTGKPLGLARDLDVRRASQNFRAFAHAVASAGQESFVTDLPDGRQALNYALLKPLGVVAVIVPWNLPLLLLTWKVAAAMACGNTVVVKPSEETPSTATLLADVVSEVGLPRGVYNVVHGFGANSAGEHLITHPDIAAVTFTGSTATGTHVMQTVASRVRPVSFELGGKNAAIVFADADIDETLNGLTKSVFANTGQVCLCTERIYVQRSIFDEVAAGLVERARGLRLGSPTDTATTTGPLISKTHRDKVLRYFDAAESAGASVITGGAIPQLGPALDGGWWVEPTLWTGLTHADIPVREEVFGPVAALMPFDTEDEAIALANDTDYGLAASVWTNDLRRGHRVAQAMHVGLSWVNTWFLRDLRAPFGGMGLSGVGREGGASSLHFYTEPTNVCVQL